MGFVITEKTEMELMAYDCTDVNDVQLERPVLQDDNKLFVVAIIRFNYDSVPIYSDEHDGMLDGNISCSGKVKVFLKEWLSKLIEQRSICFADIKNLEIVSVDFDLFDVGEMHYNLSEEEYKKIFISYYFGWKHHLQAYYLDIINSSSSFDIIERY